MEYVTFNDSEPYMKTTNTFLKKILSSVGRLMCVDLQTLCKAAKAPLAMEIIFHYLL